MKKFFINNLSFNQDEFNLSFNYLTGDFYRAEKVDNDIVLTTNFVSAPRIAYCRCGDEFVFDLDSYAVKEFVCEHFHTDTVREIIEEPYSLFKEKVRRDYELNHIEFIENWSKVIIHSDGTFEKEDYPLVPYSIPLRDAYDNLHKLLLKYKQAIKFAIEQGRFIPTITGGVDTRALSSLWKEYAGKEVNSYYIRKVKNDGKNHYDLGTADLECAKQVADRLGVKTHLDLLEEPNVTLSGMYTESTRGMYKMEVNDPRFIYKFIQHQIRSTRLLCPFADDLFLEIKHPRKNVFRCLMIKLLCPDLLDLEFIGTQKKFDECEHKPYLFEEEYRDYIDEVQEILDYWGKEKCDNILKED